MISANSLENCKGPIETFYSNGGLVRTTVDHILIQEDKVNVITSCIVLDESYKNMLFHRPISCTVSLAVRRCGEKIQNSTRVSWAKINNVDLLPSKYQEKVGKSISTLQNDIKDITSPETLEFTLNELVVKLKAAAHSVLPVQTKKRYWKKILEPNINFFE